MRWKRRVVLVASFVALAAILAWRFLGPPDPLTVDADWVRRVEVQFEPWGEDMARSPGAVSEDRQAITALVAVVRSGQETTDHKCGSRGVVILERSVGLPAELRFLPGHDPDWYELRAGGKVYRVPRGEFITAMRQIGVAVPLECQ